MMGDLALDEGERLFVALKTFMHGVWDWEAV